MRARIGVRTLAGFAIPIAVVPQNAIAHDPEAVRFALPHQGMADDTAANMWRETTRTDLQAFAEALRQNYVYAAYPDAGRWDKWFSSVLAAVEVKLRSEKAMAYIAAMTRDGRLRDDNQPQIPSLRFDGDIRDDRAVEAWVLQSVLK